MRDQGQGSIRQRGRQSWELKFDLGRDPVTGKRRIRYHSFKGTKRAAQLELTQLLSAHAKGEYIDPSRVTTSEFLDRWERDWASINVSPKTFERYSELLRKHVRPHIGILPIQKVRPTDLNELYAKLLRSGLAARTVGHVHRVVHRALVHALQWSVVHRNVSDLVSPPRVASTEIELLTPAQVQIVLHTLEGRTIYPILVMALATGMRRGELLALRWKDVNLDGGSVQVEQSLEQTKSGLRFKSPKTKHGRRSITLPPSAVTVLRDHWKAQQERRLTLGMGKALDNSLVFATWEGKPRSPSSVTKEWSLAIAATKLPRVTLHSLRHTHASHLIASGMDVLTISRRLGHGSPTITLAVYGHLFPNTDDRAAQIMEAALVPKSAE
jgi:integrase